VETVGAHQEVGAQVGRIVDVLVEAGEAAPKRTQPSSSLEVRADSGEPRNTTAARAGTAADRSSSRVAAMRRSW
jgi:hypothetical protein